MYIELNDDEATLILDALNMLPDCEEVDSVREKLLIELVPECEEDVL